MSSKAIHVRDLGRPEFTGFMYWGSRPPGGRRPKRFWVDLNGASVGWKRFWEGGVVCETLRLPKRYRWVQTGSLELSLDRREYTRRGLTDPDPSLPGVLGYSTAFTKSGFLRWYFIFRNGKYRIESLYPRLFDEGFDVGDNC